MVSPCEWTLRKPTACMNTVWAQRGKWCNHSVNMVCTHGMSSCVSTVWTNYMYMTKVLTRHANGVNPMTKNYGHPMITLWPLSEEGVQQWGNTPWWPCGNPIMLLWLSCGNAVATLWWCDDHPVTLLCTWFTLFHTVTHVGTMNYMYFQLHTLTAWRLFGCSVSTVQCCNAVTIVWW